MEQKSLSIWLKIILVGVGVCGLLVYFVVVPSCGNTLLYSYPEYAYRYWPWLIFIWVTALPFYAALFLGWKIAVNIGLDRSFSRDNARYLKWIAWLAALDAIYFFIGNFVMLFSDKSHPGVMLLSLLVVFAGVAVAAVAGALSHLVQKAAVLQEQNDLTI